METWDKRGGEGSYFCLVSSSQRSFFMMMSGYQSNIQTVLKAQTISSVGDANEYVYIYISLCDRKSHINNSTQSFRRKGREEKLTRCTFSVDTDT